MKIDNYRETIFEEIKHVDENGCEYWEEVTSELIKNKINDSKQKKLITN